MQVQGDLYAVFIYKYMFMVNRHSWKLLQFDLQNEVQILNAKPRK